MTTWPPSCTAWIFLRLLVSNTSLTKLSFIPICPVPWCWACAYLPDTILWCPSNPFLVFLSCFVHPWSWTPYPSPIGCHPFYRYDRIIQVLSPLSREPHSFWFQAFVLSLVSAASVCGDLFCIISFQMPAASFCFTCKRSNKIFSSRCSLGSFIVGTYFQR